MICESTLQEERLAGKESGCGSMHESLCRMDLVAFRLLLLVPFLLLPPPPSLGGSAAPWLEYAYVYSLGRGPGCLAFLSGLRRLGAVVSLNSSRRARLCPEMVGGMPP